MTKRVLLWVITIALLAGWALPVWAKPAPKPLPNAPEKAGRISALLPVAKIVRGAGKSAATTDAKRGDELVWNDLVKTEKGGRARITLADQSILSLGSQAELRIVKHDARAQQTALQMAYGRVRAQVANLTRDGGRFELRTPTAVAGVIGTDFGVDSSAVDGDTFVCIAGAVQISNADPNVPGSVQCSAGQTTTVQTGKSPTAPKPASLQQLQQLIEDTEPAIISSIVPAAALPGASFDSTIAGSKMGKVTSVSVAGGSGVTATVKSTSENSVQIHVVIDPTASAGPRTITLEKETGAASATVFTVLGIPIGDAKKAYLDILEQLKGTGVTGLQAFLSGAQQAADQVATQISDANQNLPKPLDLTPFASSLNQQYGTLSNNVKNGSGSIDKAAQEAATTFGTLYDPAYQALLERDPTGTPDDAFKTALTNAFQQANAILQAALQNTQTELNGAVQTYGNQLDTIQQTWSQNINNAFLAQQTGPLPKINALERIVELGNVATFDASSSSSQNARISVTGFQWTLCSQNYQPTGFGQILPENAPACNGIQGFRSTSPEFQIATCTLQPGYYYARLAVTDSNNKVSQMDVRLTVLQPNYPTPAGTVRALADAYTSLQLSQFLRWFDGAQFNGYTVLTENIRQTMQNLASMSINLRVSQENLTCNDATVRADWQQNYSFQGDGTVYSQTEQLSVRMQRTAGTGWLITDFQGDNGRVQGVPGPQTTDVASPDLTIVGATIDGRPLSVNLPTQLAAGSHSVTLDVTNTGTAALANGVLLPIVATVQDTNGATTSAISTYSGTVPTPLGAGSTATVSGNLTVPTAATSLSLVVQVNPNCNPPEKTCGAPNNASFPLILGLPDFSASFIPTATVNGIVGRAFSVQAVNVTPSPYPAPMTIAYTGLPAGLAAASPANNNTNISGTLIAGTPTASGASTVSATAAAAGTTKNVSGSVSISIGNEISITPTSAPSFVPGGPAQDLTLDVAGGVYPLTLALTLPAGFTTTSGTVNGNVANQVLTAPGLITFSLAAGKASTAGNQNFIVVVADPGIAASNTPPANLTFNVAYSVQGIASYSFTYAVAGHSAPPFTLANAFQAGEATQLDVTVTNDGNLSPAGNVTVTFDCGNPATGCQATNPAVAPAAGQSVVISFPINVDKAFPVGTYNGSLTLTPSPGATVTGSPAALPYDVVDFTIANASQSPAQNLPIGGAATLAVSVAVQTPNNPFGIAIAPMADANFTFTPATQTTSGAFIGFPLTVNAAAIPGAGTLRFNATNHGVTKFVDVPYTLFTANLTSTTLFVNDAANPLTVPVAVGAQVPARYPTVGLRVNGNFDHTNGGAALNVVQPGCGSFTAQLFPAGTVVPGDQLDLPIFGSAGNTCPPATPITVNAAIPQTYPTLTLPVYTLYVTPAGLPELAVQSATPARDFSNQPWLSGEPMDWTIVIQNSGSGISAGNERVTFYANGAELGSAPVPTTIAPGGTATLNLHVVAPDYPVDNGRIGSFLSVRVTVQSDNKGDLNPGSGDLYTGANFANWGISVLSQNGVSDASPLDLTPTGASASANVGITDPANFTPNLNLSLIAGSYSSGQLNAPNLSPAIINSSLGSTVTVSYSNTSAPINGLYLVQVIAQMKDGGVVTAQRQATIHVRLAAQQNGPDTISLSSDRSNIAPSGQCSSPGCQTIQINGPLPEAFTLTANSNCSTSFGFLCQADISFTDSFMTVTTPQLTTIQVVSPGNTLPVQVKAADNPDGSVNTGSAQVKVSVSAIQAVNTSGARTPTPDPVGQLFDMNFNIGDLEVSASPCLSIPPQDTNPIGVALFWSPINGFNVPSVQWEWQDSNHVPVGASPVLFSQAGGSSTYSGGTYSALPTFNVQNVSNGIDGLITYYFAFTVSNGVATATKYFPIDFDLSRSQTFCPILGGQRGAGANRLIRGSWGKAGLLAPNVAALSSARTANTSGKLPDLRVSASDISFTPSVPKTGDTVAVRFRISNVGEGDASAVPIALQVHGTTVASDRFDIPAGKTILGGLEWANAHAPAGAVQTATEKDARMDSAKLVRAARYDRTNPESSDAAASGNRPAGLRAQIVIDPQKTITQKTTLAKAADLSHFGLRNAAADAFTMVSIGEQHALLIQSEGACGGLRFSSGAGSCMATSDVTFTVEDLAKGTYKLEAINGIADLGMNNTSYANASYGMQAVLQDGHTYAVQLRGNNVGIVTVKAVRNPDQLSEAAKRLFRQQQAVKIVNSLGSSTGAPETGDLAGTGSQPVVYFDIVFQGQ